MSITKRVKIPIYGCDLFIVVADTMKEAIETVPGKHFPGKGEDDGDMDCKGVSYVHHPNYCIALCASDISRNIVHHEIGHVARSLMGDIGFKIHPDNDEPLAYLEGWISETVDRFLRKLANDK